ncbi:MAG TPA: sulfatase-like hydrolase/transferase [Chthoniobacteraceae bacterium]|nr:sulfatase-like hydrolase/transferase [Chthoniobacteraceae bacterium]
MNPRPNLVFICSDQHSARWTGFGGHPVVRTPNLDRLAAEGSVFDAAYSLNPICVPARAAMMTGMYASDCGSYCNSTVWNGSHPTWGTLLGEVGYRCFATGKFDLSDRFDLGFETCETGNGHDSKPDIATLFRRPAARRIDIRGQLDGRARTERVEVNRVENTLKFLDRTRSLDQPWAIYTGFIRPHSPFVGPQELYDDYLSRDPMVEDPSLEELENLHPVYRDTRHANDIATPVCTERIRRARAGYFAMITELDADIGRIRQHLEATGQLENTLFVYTSDHGESLGTHGLWMKANFYDEAVRVPLVLAGPGVPRGRRFSCPLTHADLIATLLDFAGAPLGTLRGTSLRALMNHDGPGPEFAFSELHSHGMGTGGFMIRQGPWKYVEFAYEPEGLLFHLDEDPRETINRFSDPACEPVVRSLRALLRKAVDPEAVTEAAFAAQLRRREELTEGKSVEAIAVLLQSRLGAGQAASLARSLID